MFLRRYIPLIVAGALAAGASAAKTAAGPALPFIENDYEKAMAAAKAQQRPVFVEVWAPW
jgi:hypothetical protein